MEAPDCGSFANADAGAWLLEMEAAHSLFHVRRTLQKASDARQIDAPLGCQAIVAGEMVNALLHENRPLPDQARKAIAALKTRAISRGLTDLAINVLERIEAKSDLQIAWDKTPSARQWHANVNALITSLQA